MSDGDRLAAQTHWLRLLLLHLAGRQVRARVELDDLVQEVFLRALGADLPPDEPALRRLLARLARHAVVDAVRALRARKRSAPEVRLTRSDWSRTGVAESEVRLRTAGPATRAARAEEHERLLQAFDRLAPEHRRVIGLRQFEGLAAAEAARRMGRSETAVHSLYRRALEAWSQEAR
jgi:RNA polymerase sigma-70 factor (ECF subfamily)